VSTPSGRATAGYAAAFAVLTLLVTMRWAPLLELDRVVGARLHAVAVTHPALVRAGDVGAVVLHPNVFRVAIALCAAWLVWRGRPWPAFWAVFTMAIGGLAGIATKLLTARDRPSFPDPVGHAAGYSFPSGHAINAALAVLIIGAVVWPSLRRRALAVAVGVSVVVLAGLDRMVLGVHHLTDIVGAWLAAAAIVGATAWLMRLGRTPEIAPRSARGPWCGHAGPAGARRTMRVRGSGVTGSHARFRSWCLRA
jgi:membrane-associated phospholipid phosphatase